MRIGLRKEIYTTGSCEGFETLNYLRGIHEKLFYSHSGDRKRNFEILAMLCNKVTQDGIGREIALFCHSFEDGTVSKLVEIMKIVADIKKAKLPKSVRLVYLKV
jgi:hypothetical protein